MAITDEEAALRAIQSFISPENLSEEQQDATRRINSIVKSDDPFIDIHELFGLYDVLYFRKLLVSRIEVSWRPRLTLCAGICELVRDPENGNRYTRIRLKLSEPLLKYRPKSDVVDTLLHESIHAYFFVTTDWKHVRGDDGTGHGSGFLLLADAINSHGGYGISVYHTFHDEVDSYRTHVWQCDGSCREMAPYFGLVKRSMNRAPGPNDSWWGIHLEQCGGSFAKISELEPSKSAQQRLSALERAGRQSNKIESWVVKGDGSKKPQDSTGSGGGQIQSTSRSERQEVDIQPESIEFIDAVDCPICGRGVAMESMSDHLDTDHPL